MKTWQMEVLHCSHLCSILPLPRPPQARPRRPLPPLTPSASPSSGFNLNPISHSIISFSTKYKRWDSNAESVRSRKFNFSFRGKDENNDEEEEGDDGDDYGTKRRWWSDESPGMEEATAGGIWDELWVFKALLSNQATRRTLASIVSAKVFRSYGWTLPLIFLSWLLASGPKAFLMALALPLGQSALQLAFEKLWGRSKSKPRRKSRMRRKPFGRNVGGTAMEEDGQKDTQKTRNGKPGYQSWVVENGGSVDSSGQNDCSFGGWDDLESSGPATSSSGGMHGSQDMPIEEGKLSRRERKSDTPLLLRLLIAVFPFLGTWTKML